MMMTPWFPVSAIAIVLISGILGLWGLIREKRRVSRERQVADHRKHR
jgi:hypothetical protein